MDKFLGEKVPGRVVLTVEARSRLGGEPATPEIQFTISALNQAHHEEHDS